mmetsp:Transcript_11690/g.27127  ORF Transcript_11690/g.27127 Transcript_11690/m.27127 type:complete len:273 (-) Transcript_11690:210-1028(-)
MFLLQLVLLLLLGLPFLLLAILFQPAARILCRFLPHRCPCSAAASTSSRRRCRPRSPAVRSALLGHLQRDFLLLPHCRRLPLGGGRGGLHRVGGGLPALSSALLAVVGVADLEHLPQCAFPKGSFRFWLHKAQAKAVAELLHVNPVSVILLALCRLVHRGEGAQQDIPSGVKACTVFVLRDEIGEVVEERRAVQGMPQRGRRHPVSDNLHFGEALPPKPAQRTLCRGGGKEQGFEPYIHDLDGVLMELIGAQAEVQVFEGCFRLGEGLKGKI